jgi:hypothetical protein
MFELELGEDASTSKCSCCGIDSSIGHGFVYKNSAPYAVYYAGWSFNHRERGVTMAIAIGRWDEDSTSEDRTAFGLNAYEGENDILFQFLDPESSPWGSTSLLGNMIRRDDALNHPLKPDLLIVAETIVRNHLGIRAFLGGFSLG